MDIFQLTQADIDRSTTLDADDVGKWCFIVRGCLFGFYSNREEALAKLTQLHLPDR